ncbi:nucleic acid-binding protein [Choiromyces venosus 120613-1]|uniref:Nucleic acid-binding protein n=1 Tax=Choiromyces venosus 120613-1 TaxID=1336337 RepID=A0A3N4J2M1_9PEZI|nr:nucleic acid-binding protein [Choiromyces venosus 120613-1]
MASPVLSVSPSDVTLPLILSSYKSLPITVSTEEKPAVSSLTLSNNDTIAGTNTIVSHLSTLIPLFAKTTYTDAESAEITQWLTLTSATPIPEEAIAQLNRNLKFRTTILGEKLSIADVAVYARIKSQVASWSDEQKTGEKGYRYIVRWVDFVQNTPDLGLQIPAEEKIVVDPSKVLVYLKPEEPVKEKKKEGGVAGEDSKKKVKGRAGAGKVKEEAEKVKEAVKDAAGRAATVVIGEGKQGKKEKKDKPKREAPKKEEPVISPSQIDLRVGHILHCMPHPNADSLFVSTISMGDPEGSPLVTPHSELSLPSEVLAEHAPLPTVRTVCSGLNGLVPIEEMQGRKVVVVANLKPVTMRGIKSTAMVLAASPAPAPGGDPTAHKKETVELVTPPEGAVAGQRVYFEGYKAEPEAVLNPKKKIWEQIQPGFATTSELDVVFDREKAGWTGDAAQGKAPGEGPVGKLVTEGGVCKVKSLVGAAVR